MKILHYGLAAAAALSLCSCTNVSSPAAPSAIAKADILMATAGFEPDFYKAFVQNGYESPARLEPVRLLKSPPRIYLQTTDAGGRAIDAATLALTEATLIESAQIWSGGQFGVAEVARGTGTREKVQGWITVKWSALANETCGRSTVGVDGGVIELNASGSCSCGSATLIYPRLVRHELGHAMGFYHTDSANDVMYGKSVARDACTVTPSSRERLHARFAHTQ